MGYLTQNGYWGKVGDRYMLFIDEEEYLEFLAE